MQPAPCRLPDRDVSHQWKRVQPLESILNEIVRHTCIKMILAVMFTDTVTSFSGVRQSNGCTGTL